MIDLSHFFCLKRKKKVRKQKENHESKHWVIQKLKDVGGKKRREERERERNGVVTLKEL